MKMSMGTSCLAAALFAGTALGQTVITQWDFNAAGLNFASPAPSTGVGTLALLGGVVAPGTGGFPSGSGSSDIGSPNSSWSFTGFPAQGTGNGTAGFSCAVSTVGYENIRFGFDPRFSTSPSKWYRTDYSTDGGTNWTLGTVWSQDSSSSFINQNGTLLPPRDPRVIDLSAVPAADNNANFRFRVVAVFSPVDFTILPPSAQAGTYLANTSYEPNNVDTSTTRVYTPASGTWRFDMVTVSGDPLISLPPTGTVVTLPPAVCLGGSSQIEVTTTPGVNPPSTTVSATANLTAIGGGSSVPMNEIAPGFFTLGVTAPGSAGSYTIPVTVSDTELGGRSTIVNASLAVANCSGDSGAGVVISQVYGGGGSATAFFDNDYVELFNRCSSPVDLTGMSLQYAAASNSTGFTGKMDLSGTIPAGGYYLVQVTADLAVPVFPITPTPDLKANATNISSISMAQGAGRIALVSSTAFATSCGDASIMDMVGYGAAACFEGAGPGVALSQTLAGFRKNAGCQDANQNFNDFEALSPAPRSLATAPNTSCPVTCGGGGGCFGACVADFDDGTGTGTPDGGVTIDDLLYYLGLFDSGDTCADVDDGSGTNTLDGGVTIDDLIYFLARFDAGC